MTDRFDVVIVGGGILGLFSTAGASDLGQTFIVIDPAAADPSGDFAGRLEGYLDQLVSAPTVPGAPGRVLVAGEPEAEAERRSDAGGIAIDAVHAASLDAIGERARIPFPGSEPAVGSDSTSTPGNGSPTGSTSS